MLKLYFFHALVAIFKSTDSIAIALIVTCTVALAFATNKLIWRLHVSRITKYLLIVSLYCGAAGVFYISTVGLSQYFFKKDVQLAESELRVFFQDMREELRKTYLINKEMNIAQETLEIMDRLTLHILDDKIDPQICIEELRHIDMMLDNPFINETNSKPLNILRRAIVETLMEYGKENSDFLIHFSKAEKVHEICKKIHCDPIRIEFYRVLLETEPFEVFQFMEKLLKTKEGRIKFKHLISLNELELEFLTMCLDDTDFEDLVRDCLLKIPQLTYQKFSRAHVERYTKDCLPEFLKTIEGRKKIIRDLKQLYGISTVLVETLCNMAEKENTISYLTKTYFGDSFEIQVNPKVTDIIKTIGNV